MLQLSEPTFIFQYDSLKVVILLQEAIKSWTKAIQTDSSSNVCSTGTATLLVPAAANVVFSHHVSGNEDSTHHGDDGIGVDVQRLDTQQRALSVASEFRGWSNQETLLML